MESDFTVASDCDDSADILDHDDSPIDPLEHLDFIENTGRVIECTDRRRWRRQMTIEVDQKGGYGGRGFEGSDTGRLGGIEVPELRTLMAHAHLDSDVLVRTPHREPCLSPRRCQ